MGHLGLNKMLEAQSSETEPAGNVELAPRVVRGLGCGLGSGFKVTNLIGGRKVVKKLESKWKNGLRTKYFIL